MARWSIKPPFPAQLVRGHSLCDGLVGCWPLNEGAGNKAYDLSGNDYHGTLTNFATTGDWVATERGVCPDLDGTDDHITCGDIFSAPTALTFSLWVYIDAYASSGARFIDKGLGHTGFREYGFYLSAAHYPTFLLFNDSGSSSKLCQYASAVSTGQWLHMVATWDGSTMYIYQDGEQVASTGSAAIVIEDLSDPLVFGSNYVASSTVSLNGKMSNVCIYNRALSADEVRRLYTRPYDIFKSAAPLFFIPFAATGTIEQTIAPVTQALAGTFTAAESGEDTHDGADPEAYQYWVKKYEEYLEEVARLNEEDKPKSPKEEIRQVEKAAKAQVTKRTKRKTSDIEVLTQIKGIETRLEAINKELSDERDREREEQLRAEELRRLARLEHEACLLCEYLAKIDARQRYLIKREMDEALFALII